MSTPTVLYWFRQDLRLEDNPALNRAIELCQQHTATLLLVYIQDQSHEHEWQNGEASNWWLHHSLLSLNNHLEKQGQQLLILTGKPQQIIDTLVQTYNVTHVTWNRQYEPWARHRDTGIKSQLKEQGINVRSFNGTLLWEPEQIAKKDGSPYKVFTHYYRRGCLGQPHPRRPLTLNAAIGDVENQTLTAQHQNTLGEMGINALQLLPCISWDSEFYSHWQPGEATARNKLDQFAATAAQAYKSQRDFPATPGTSKLSPHLHFGEISPQQIWHSIQASVNGEALDHQELDCYLSEIGWREFSYYLLYHFQHIPKQNFQAKFNHFPWQHNHAALEAWQQGKTGYPIVDAGMRELWQTGYMHNRVRMIVGSFLVKNLLIHWHHGEAWFWDCLLDADLAANSASWQWIAGSGADAAPYFRVFNPVTQGQKFDKDGNYVKTYCPELSKLPPKYIHCPWEAPTDILRACGIKLGNTYPKPIVDLAESRKGALEAFAQCKAAFEESA